MKLRKKWLIIGFLCVVVLAATIGGFTIASADDSTAKTGTAVNTLMDKVAEIYQKNTGTAIDSAQLQKAFEEAGAALRTDRMDQMLQNLVDSGKITQAQADQWKAWWNSRPAQITSDEFKTWMQSHPEIPGLTGGNGAGKIMPFGGMRGFGGMGASRGNAPCLND
jgi:hypothetical protein